MDWISNLQAIRRILEAKGFGELSDELLKERMVGGTPGEGFIQVVAKLISIRTGNPAAYDIIREEAEWMIKYAQTIRYLP